MAQMAGAEGSSLTQISWEDTGARVYIPQWTRLVQAHAAGLKGITPAALPGIAGDLKGLGQSLRALTNQPRDDESAPALANGVVGAALLLLLIARGGQLHVIPGEDFFVRLDGHEVKPFHTGAAGLAKRRDQRPGLGSAMHRSRHCRRRLERGRRACTRCRRGDRRSPPPHPQLRAAVGASPMPPP